MTENLEPVATPPAAAPVEAAAPAAAPSKKKAASLWAGVLAAVLVAGGAGFALGNHGGAGDRIDRVSFNGPMMGGNDDNQGQLGQGQGIQPGQGMQPGQGFGGPHCENTSGDHKAVNADGSCPTGYTLDQGRGGMRQPQPNASASVPQS